MREHIEPTQSVPQFDNVNHPQHYASGNIECIDAMESAFGPERTAFYCRVNAFKYIWRAGKKEGKLLEDLEKANWYINKSIELLKKP